MITFVIMSREKSIAEIVINQLILMNYESKGLIRVDLKSSLNDLLPKPYSYNYLINYLKSNVNTDFSSVSVSIETTVEEFINELISVWYNMHHGIKPYSTKDTSDYHKEKPIKSGTKLYLLDKDLNVSDGIVIAYHQTYNFYKFTYMLNKDRKGITDAQPLYHGDSMDTNGSFCKEGKTIFFEKEKLIAYLHKEANSLTLRVESIYKTIDSLLNNPNIQ